MIYEMTIEAVAAELNVCTQTVRNRMKQRSDLVPNIAKKVGRRWRFSPAVLTSPIALTG